LFGNYLHKLTFVPLPDAEPENDRGVQYALKWQFTLDLTWNIDPVTVNYGFNFWSKTLRFSHNTVKCDPDIASEENKFYDARHTHDMYVAWDVADKKYQFYVGVNNIFNQKPDLVTYYPVSPLGRVFYAGFKANFADVFGGK
jgi:iron complex outermembrane receptor protein